MKKTIVYHNPRCSKSRQVLSILDENNIKYDVVNYIKEPLEKNVLSNLLKLLKISAEELTRKNDKLFKDLYKNSDKLTERDYFDILLKNPILMQRPIVVCKNRAVVGRPPETVLNIISV
ncbi:MAG: arsenate reductase (glutaredoxin) [Legionellales bacterium]|nr:arsenate reductase (glutaredoxin) [Legionellales bacterium]